MNNEEQKPESPSSSDEEETLNHQILNIIWDEGLQVTKAVVDKLEELFNKQLKSELAESNNYLQRLVNKVSATYSGTFKELSRAKEFLEEKYICDEETNHWVERPNKAIDEMVRDMFKTYWISKEEWYFNEANFTVEEMVMHGMEYAVKWLRSLHPSVNGSVPKQIADKLAEALEGINNVCGTVNFSSHNQMRESIEAAVELSEAALESYKNILK